MTAIVQAAATGGVSGTANAQNVRGSAVGVAPGATQTLASVVAGTHKVRGFQVFATTDAEAWLEQDAVPMAGFRKFASRVKDAYFVLPNPEPVPAGALLELKIMNTGAVAGDFEGTLFAE